MFYYIYVLLSERDGKRYIGYTGNLKKRMKEHGKGLVSSTKYRRPLKLIYYEACLDEEDVRSREKYLKNRWGYKFLDKRLKKFYENL